MTGWIVVSPRALDPPMADGDDRDDDLLEHRPTVDEACTPREMKAIRAFGNPELHAPFGHGRDESRAVPGRSASGKSWPIR